MKYVIGDIHGKKEIVEFFLNNFNQEDLIFVGDILDSFNRSVEDQIESLLMIKESDATLLMGNHELSYISREYQCSGFNSATRAHLIHQDEYVRSLPKYVWVDDVLVSHAGLTLEWFEEDPTIDQVRGFLEEMPESEMFQIPYSRGGPHPVGGILWEDFRYHTPIPGLTQICGHTRGQDVRQKGQSYCIDCLEDNDRIKYVGIENNEVCVYNELGDEE